MPLTRRAKKIKRSMDREYGKKKGDRVFWAWTNTPNGRKVLRGKR